MKRILIVDDTMFMRTSLRMVFEKGGHEIVGEAENGLVAIQKYKELYPDVVTMDITMPELNGIDTIKIIKQIDENAKIIVVSALGQEKIVMDAINAGAKGFIIKPIKEEHILKTIEGL